MPDLIFEIMKNICLFSVAAMMLATACTSSWSRSEKDLIRSQGDVMHVYTVDVPSEDTLLRTPCKDFSLSMISSELYGELAGKMLSTVTSPEQDGVGIAGPQVGISRRVVAVLRYDKQDEPFEVYPNIRITAFHGELVPGPEGCLSVPGRRGDVPRYQDIEISYVSPATLRDTTERITGYTAVIFQHECDHLDGVIYMDRIIR